ncbi:hypothetical protein EVAR_33880_1 [Eumeta japonica]|uniref:Uncharacterized protein n=1 Tax=Eumeta variegata TaxID=151549 RepID=A0A4C1WLE9_EUMVA|nr:hypothetical protein EVAR_33880_1 [Eumeta japonica]
MVGKRRAGKKITRRKENKENKLLKDTVSEEDHLIKKIDKAAREKDLGEECLATRHNCRKWSPNWNILPPVNSWKQENRPPPAYAQRRAIHHTDTRSSPDVDVLTYLIISVLFPSVFCQASRAPLALMSVCRPLILAYISHLTLHSLLKNATKIVYDTNLESTTKSTHPPSDILFLPKMPTLVIPLELRGFMDGDDHLLGTHMLQACDLHTSNNLKPLAPCLSKKFKPPVWDKAIVLRTTADYSPLTR